MIIDLRPIFAEPGKRVDVSDNLNFSDIENSGGFPINKPGVLSGEIKNSAGIVMLHASVEFEYTASCDRCAEKVTKKMTLPIEHILVDRVDNEDEGEFIVIPNCMFNITEFIKDDVSLLLPTKFLCKEDCAGICPGCGKNLNVETCSCEKDVDPRFAALRNLLD